MKPYEVTNDRSTPQENMVYARRQLEWAIQAKQDLHWRYAFEGNEIVIRDNMGYIPGLRFRFAEDLAKLKKQEREEALETIRESLNNMFPLTSGWSFKPNFGG